MFYYALQGRKKGTGILSKKGGKIISKGIAQIPTKYYEEMKSILDQHKIKHTTNFVLQYGILH